MTDYNDNEIDFSTADVEIESKGLPIGFHKAMALKQFYKNNPKKPENPNMLVVTWEVVEGEAKGKQGDVYYNVNHSIPKTARIAKETVKKIEIATGVVVDKENPIKGRVCVLDIRPQKDNPQYSEIKGYYPENYVAQQSEGVPF